MALLHVSFKSKTLMRSVPITVLLPTDADAFSDKPGRADAPYKTLYLLHGVYGNSLSWLTETRIARLSERKKLAVVMPSGDNGFYVDHPGSHDHYGQFIGEELVEATRRMFPLSRAWEDTYIAGLSMGGFGAIRNGLKYHETFSRIAGFSSALVLEMAAESTYDDPQFIKSRGFFESCFGDIGQAIASDKNPDALVAALADKKARRPETPIPEIYLSCGTEDQLIGCSREFSALLKSHGIRCDYYEGPGAHDWAFWDAEIEKAIEWLPLGE